LGVDKMNTPGSHFDSNSAAGISPSFLKELKAYHALLPLAVLKERSEAQYI